MNFIFHNIVKSTIHGVFLIKIFQLEILSSKTLLNAVVVVVIRKKNLISYN